MVNKRDMQKRPQQARFYSLNLRLPDYYLMTCLIILKFYLLIIEIVFKIKARVEITVKPKDKSL